MYRTHQSIITDNVTKFTYKNSNKLLEYLNVKQHFALVKHPQTNEQVEATNEALLRGMKRRLEAPKGNLE